ncbi:GPW/gp25 family protein [Actinomycetospora lemnae]|uniref:GPW/gp25 family protein n=1 Tax=Actinomycetospora lemnae TaxID=3019891 RepID=A0ABT5SRJ6_9PSEU|nr:GPW/gp25 family protein [Actinomycetospora sp. DW7H6]MDD7965489.1 GPW/gp25 family protein [Actinomycetospora sp. DW7H6]
MTAPPRVQDPADAWLGTGFRFPIEKPAYSSGMARVRQAIETIIGTEPGERVMLPEFGCGLRRFLMAPNNPATRSAIAEEITQALTLWEPRIRLTGVTVTPAEEPTVVWIDIAYVRRVDLRADNIVYPFALR